MGASPDELHLPGCGEMEAIIAEHEDVAQIDDLIRARIPEATFVVLGEHQDSGVLVLHCEVPYGDGSIPLVPVFTRWLYAETAIMTNPRWSALEPALVDGEKVLEEAGEYQWIGINVWSGKREFKLPPRQTKPVPVWMYR